MNGGGLAPGKRQGASGVQGLVSSAGRRTPCEERAVILTAVQSLRLACSEGACWEGGGLDGAMMRQAVSVVVRCGRRLEGAGVLCEGAVARAGF